MFKPTTQHIIAWLNSLSDNEDYRAAAPFTNNIFLVPTEDKESVTIHSFCAEAHIDKENLSKNCLECGGDLYDLPYSVSSEEELKEIFNSEQFMRTYFKKAHLTYEGKEGKSASLFLLDHDDLWVGQYIETNLVVVFQENKNNYPGFGKWIVAVVHEDWLEFYPQ